MEMRINEIQNIVEGFIDKCNFTFTDEMEEELYNKVDSINDITDIVIIENGPSDILLMDNNTHNIISDSSTYEIDEDFIDSY